MVEDRVYFKHKYITMPTITKADVVVQTAKQWTGALEKNEPSAIPATNGDLLRKLAAIYDSIARKKLPEAEWERPASPRVLEETAHPRVTQPVPIPRMEEPTERLIVKLSDGSKVAVSLPTLNTRSRQQPVTITQEATFATLEKSGRMRVPGKHQYIILWEQ